MLWILKKKGGFFCCIKLATPQCAHECGQCPQSQNLNVPNVLMNVANVPNVLKVPICPKFECPQCAHECGQCPQS